LVWCSPKQAENELKTTHVSRQCLSLAENPSIQKRSYSAGFQAENNPFKNPSTDVPEGARASSSMFYAWATRG